MYTIKKIYGYVYTTKKFGDTCVPLHKLFFYMCAILNGMETSGS